MPERKALISVKEARKLLGVSGRDLSDEQVKELVDQLTVIGRWAMREYVARVVDPGNTKKSLT